MVHDVIGNTRLCELSDDCMVQVMEPQLWQSGLSSEIAPCGIPLLHGATGVQTAPLPRAPNIMPRLGKTQDFSMRPHRRWGFSGNRIDWYHPMAAFQLAARDLDDAVDQVHVSPTQVLHFNWTSNTNRNACRASTCRLSSSRCPSVCHPTSRSCVMNPPFVSRWPHRNRRGSSKISGMLWIEHFIVLHDLFDTRSLHVAQGVGMLACGSLSAAFSE